MSIFLRWHKMCSRLEKTAFGKSRLIATLRKVKIDYVSLADECFVSIDIFGLVIFYLIHCRFSAKNSARYPHVIK